MQSCSPAHVPNVALSAGLALDPSFQCHWDANNDSASAATRAFAEHLVASISAGERELSSPSQGRRRKRYLPLARNDGFGLYHHPARGWPLTGAWRGSHGPSVAHGLELAHDRFPKAIWWLCIWLLHDHITGTDRAAPLP